MNNVTVSSDGRNVFRSIGEAAHACRYFILITCESTSLSFSFSLAFSLSLSPGLVSVEKRSSFRERSKSSVAPVRAAPLAYFFPKRRPISCNLPCESRGVARPQGYLWCVTTRCVSLTESSERSRSIPRPPPDLSNG